MPFRFFFSRATNVHYRPSREEKTKQKNKWVNNETCKKIKWIKRLNTAVNERKQVSNMFFIRTLSEREWNREIGTLAVSRKWLVQTQKYCHQFHSKLEFNDRSFVRSFSDSRPFLIPPHLFHSQTNKVQTTEVSVRSQKCWYINHTTNIIANGMNEF